MVAKYELLSRSPEQPRQKPAGVPLPSLRLPEAQPTKDPPTERTSLGPGKSDADTDPKKNAEDIRLPKVSKTWGQDQGPKSSTPKKTVKMTI